MSEDDEDYHIGYCKPPEKTQFKKGQSGNPKGRPIGSRKSGMLTIAHKDFRDFIYDEVLTFVEIKEDGTPITITKLQLILKQLMNKAIKGETRAIQTTLQLLERTVLSEHKDIEMTLESEWKEREYRKQKLFGDEVLKSPKLKELEDLFDYFSDRKIYRFALGEERMPYEDLEPRTEKEWNMLLDHIADVRDEKEFPRFWIDPKSDRFQNSQIAKDMQEECMQKLKQEDPEFFKTLQDRKKETS